MNRRQLLQRAGVGLPTLLLPSLFSQAAPLDCMMARPDGEGRLRLGSNENPYGPSPKAKAAMMEAMSDSNRYPRQHSQQLAEALGAYHGYAGSHILQSGGSSDMLGLIVMLAARSGAGNIVYPNPTFSSWIPLAKHLGMELKAVPLNSRHEMDLAALEAAVDGNTRLVYLCNPNNPTGTIVDSKMLEATCRRLAAKCWVLVDEAYTEFENIASMQALVKEYPRIIIVKTFSKIFGLAGSRVGYALAQPQTLQQLAAFVPWPHSHVSAVSASAAIASLGDESFVRMCREKNAEARQYTINMLREHGVDAVPSYTNFIYFPVTKLKNNYFSFMQEKKVDLRNHLERGITFCRLSIGKPEEMQQFAKVFESLG